MDLIPFGYEQRCINKTRVRGRNCCGHDRLCHTGPVRRAIACAPRPESVSGREPGVYPLSLRRQRDALLYVPKTVPSHQPAPLLVYPHGAGGAAQQGIKRLSSFADEFGFLLLSPASQGDTWDAIQDGFGRDARMIDEALTSTFDSLRVDTTESAVSGFSDGASYALGLGLANGDLFRFDCWRSLPVSSHRGPSRAGSRAYSCLMARKMRSCRSPIAAGVWCRS